MADWLTHQAVSTQAATPVLFLSGAGWGTCSILSESTLVQTSQYWPSYLTIVCTACHMKQKYLFWQSLTAQNEDHRRRIGRLQSRKGYHTADLQPMHSMWELSPAPARPLPCRHRLQERLRQGLACSFVGNHEEVQHQHKPYTSHQKPLEQGH